MKVLQNFYCIKSKKTYLKGDAYEGDRKDLKGFVEYKAPKKKAVKPKK